MANRLHIGSLSLLLGGCLGLLLGLGLNQRLLDQRTSPAAPLSSQEASLETTSPKLLLPAHRGLDDAFRKALQKSTRTQNWLWLATQAETASPEEMPRLVRLAAGDAELLKMLGAHWASLDPQHMLTYLLADQRSAQRSIEGSRELLNQLIRQWGESDAAGLADALSDDELFAGYQNFRWSGVNAIMKEDPTLGLRMLTRWNIQNYTPSMNKVGDWAKKDPTAAAQLVGSLTNHYARKRAFEEVAKAWSPNDLPSAIEFAKTSLTGSGQDELTSALMTRWVKENLDEAIGYAVQQDDARILAAMSEPLVAAWARKDPAAALAWSQEALPTPARVQAVSTTIAAIARDNLELGRQLVADSPPGGTRNQAASAFLETWLDQPDLDVEALGQWLGNFEDKVAQSRAINNAQWDWVRKHPESAKDFLASEHGGLATEGMIRRLASGEVRKDPQAALDWARSLDGEPGEKAQRFAVEQWYHMQPDAAMQWATQEAQGDERTQAIQGISRSLAFASEDRLRSWVALLKADERRVAREFLDAMRLAKKHAAVVRRVFDE